MITLPPFKSFLASNIPSVYDNTLSYYDELTKLIAYLEQQVVPAVNKNSEDIQKYVDGLEQLKEYVDHYFDNLDVQTEINNKLDAMAEDGTLAEIINQEIFGELDAKVDSAKEVTDAIRAAEVPFTYNYLYNAGDGFGNSLVATGDKTIIVDFGDRAGVVDNYLHTKGITKIDAIVLTHYHNDHAGGLNAQGLIEVITDASLDLTDCVVYLPHKNIDWTQVTTSDKSLIMATENTVKSALTTAGVAYYEPNNEEKVDLSDRTSLEFFNIGSSFYDHYYPVDTTGMSGTTDYNAFSMLVKINHNNISELETGDVTPVAQKYNAKYVTEIDIYHSVHHGVYTPIAKDWAIKINPTYCVVTKNAEALVADNADIEICGSKKATILSVKEIKDVTTITQIGDDLYCNSQVTNNRLDMAVTSRPSVMLEPNTDLDDIVDDGSYFSPSAAQTLTMSNIPPCKNADHTIATNLASFRLDVIKKGSWGGNNRNIVQYLTYGNIGITFGGIWYRQKPGFADTWTGWTYLKPSIIEGSHSVSDAYAFGTVSGDNKYLNLCIPSIDILPTALNLTNGAMTRCNLKGIGGVVAYAENATQAANYEATITKGTSGFYISIHKVNNENFGTINTPVCGLISFSYDLEKY